MFRNISIVLVTFILCFSCDNSSIEKTNSKKFDTNAYIKNNQNERVRRFLDNSELINEEINQEFYFVNKSGCDACVNNKYKEVIEILKLTNVNSVVIINDSTFFRSINNSYVSFKFVTTEELKSKEIFHSTPWLYSSINGAFVDKKLTSPICDSLLNRFRW